MFEQIGCCVLYCINRLGCVTGEKQMIDGLAEHLLLREPPRRGAVEPRNPIRCVALEPVQKILGEEVMVLKPGPVGICPSEKEVALLDVFQDVPAARIAAEGRRQPATDLGGDTCRKQEIEKVRLEAVENVRCQILAYCSIPSRQARDECGGIAVAAKRQRRQL